MQESKLKTITNLFEGKEIRSMWDSEKEDYYFSVIDVIRVLTESPNPRNYWNMLKRRMKEDEGSELYTNCVQLKLKSSDGKYYGGGVAKIARDDLEQKLGESIISNKNSLGYRYIDKSKQIEVKEEL